MTKGLIFTRRHYVWLASAMRDIMTLAREREGIAAVDCRENARLFIRDLATALASESPAFHTEKFMHNSLCDPTDHPFGDRCPHVMAKENTNV